MNKKQYIIFWCSIFLAFILIIFIIGYRFKKEVLSKISLKINTSELLGKAPKIIEDLANKMTTKTQKPDSVKAETTGKKSSISAISYSTSGNLIIEGEKDKRYYKNIYAPFKIDGDKVTSPTIGVEIWGGIQPINSTNIKDPKISFTGILRLPNRIGIFVDFENSIVPKKDTSIIRPKVSIGFKYKF